MPRSRLETAWTRESLVALAVELTSEIGLDEVTVRALARRAGVFPAVIYHHVGDLEAVRYAVGDQVISAIVIPPAPPDPRTQWRPWLRELAANGFDRLRRHHGVYRFIARTGPSSPSQLAVIDRTMQVLMGAGLDDRTASLCYNAFIGHVGAAADVDAAIALRTGDRVELRAHFEQQLRNVAALHPGVAAAIPHFLAWDQAEAFRFTLDLILDGIDVAISRAAPR